MIKIRVSGSHVQVTKSIKPDVEVYVDSADFTNHLDATCAAGLLESALKESHVPCKVERGDHYD